MISLTSFLQRLPRVHVSLWHRRRTVDLEPTHQQILRALRYFRQLSFEALHAEVNAERSTHPGDVLLALVKLESDGLITRVQAPGANRRQASYAATRAGRRVAALLPANSASTIAFHL